MSSDLADTDDRDAAMTRALIAAGYTPASVRDTIASLHRQVQECPAGWQVTDSGFVTTDRALARAVAAELDRIEPLPGSIDLLKHETGRDLRLRRMQ